MQSGAPGAEKLCQGRQNTWRAVRVMPVAVTDKALDPDHRRRHLPDLPETGEQPDHKDQKDKGVEVKVGQKHRHDLWQGHKKPSPHKAQHHQHHKDLAEGLRKLRLDLFAARELRPAVRLIHRVGSHRDIALGLR